MVDLSAWLAGKVPHKQWRKLVAKDEIPPADTTLPTRDIHLAHKYLGKWKEKVITSTFILSINMLREPETVTNIENTIKLI